MTDAPQSLQDADDAASNSAQYVESALWALRRGDIAEACTCLTQAKSAAINADYLIGKALAELAAPKDADRALTHSEEAQQP